MSIKTKKRKSVKAIASKSFNSSIKFTNSIINDVKDEGIVKIDKTPINTRVTDVENNINTEGIYQVFPILFPNPNSIMIPNKALTFLRMKEIRPCLDKIHGQAKTAANREIAIELCLLFLSQLSSTYRNMINGEEPEGWKSLRAVFLRELLWINEKTYQNVEEALLYKFESAPILERGTYAKGQYSTKFRLSSVHRAKGFKPYELKTDIVRNLYQKSCVRKIKEAQKNTICTNLLELYNNITLPTIQEIKDEAQRLIANNYVSKKGKKLQYLNKKPKSYYKNLDKTVFVEDAIKIFNYLTKNGFLIPRAGDFRSGGRVVDSFTLMPSWIRKLVKVNGEPMIECDYSCLHPNIAMSMYGGSSKFITHQCISERTGIDILIIKTEHLSFFNKKVWSMTKSALYDYYKNSESTMLENVMSEKKFSEFDHRITSQRLFKKEVDIMRAIIKRLNEAGIFVGYIYDALFCEPKHQEQVKKIMDEVILDFDVYTTAKLE